MTETKSLLILEDEDRGRQELGLAFEDYNERTERSYDFQVEMAASPQDCVKQGLDRKSFDVYLIDLEMIRGTKPFFGHLFLEIRAFEVPGSVLIVYSQHDQVQNITRAMRSGATDFIVKAQCQQDGVPDRVAGLLDELAGREEEHMRLDELAEEHADEWRAEYPGKVLLIVDKDVIKAYDTRVAAVVDYAEQRRDHADWPDEPQLIEIPEDDEVGP